jgi:hypothetical protein
MGATAVTPIPLSPALVQVASMVLAVLALAGAIGGQVPFESPPRGV